MARRASAIRDRIYAGQFDMHDYVQVSVRIPDGDRVMVDNYWTEITSLLIDNEFEWDDELWYGFKNPRYQERGKTFTRRQVLKVLRFRDET